MQPEPHEHPNKDGLEPRPVPVASDLTRYPGEAGNLYHRAEHTPGPRVIEMEESHGGKIEKL